MNATPLISSTRASSLVCLLTKLQVMAMASFPRNSLRLNFKQLYLPSHPLSTSNSCPLTGEDGGEIFTRHPFPVFTVNKYTGNPHNCIQSIFRIKVLVLVRNHMSLLFYRSFCLSVWGSWCSESVIISKIITLFYHNLDIAIFYN